MALGAPSQTQVNSPMSQQQFAQRQLQNPQQPQSSPMAPQQPQLTYPGDGGNQPLPTADFSNHQASQGQQSRPQTPLPLANFNNFRQAQSLNATPNIALSMRSKHKHHRVCFGQRLVEEEYVGLGEG